MMRHPHRVGGEAEQGCRTADIEIGHVDGRHDLPLSRREVGQAPRDPGGAVRVLSLG
jgi:hypothetical protein